jgi:hypothetical protein
MSRTRFCDSPDHDAPVAHVHHVRREVRLHRGRLLDVVERVVQVLGRLHQALAVEDGDGVVDGDDPGVLHRLRVLVLDPLDRALGPEVGLDRDRGERPLRLRGLGRGGGVDDVRDPALLPHGRTPLSPTENEPTMAKASLHAWVVAMRCSVALVFVS